MAQVKELFGARVIQETIRGLAKDIADTYGDRPLVMVVLLKGAFIFAADLMRALHDVGVHPEVDFLCASSYGDGTESRGTVEVLTEPTSDLSDRDVLLVDDILDTGRSLEKVKGLLEDKGASRVRTCVLLDKPSRRIVDVTADFSGLEIPDRFVVGYGVDLAEKYRHLPFVGVLEE